MFPSFRGLFIPPAHYASFNLRICSYRARLYTRFNSPIPAVIRSIPIYLIFNPSFIVFVMNQKICSTRTLILLFL